MRRKINPWLLAMFAAPLCLLVIPLLPRGSGQVRAPDEHLLFQVFEGLFYLVAVGGGLTLVLRSVWGASGEQVGRFIGAVCLFLVLPSLLLIPTLDYAAWGICGGAGFLLLGLVLVGKRRQ